MSKYYMPTTLISGKNCVKEYPEYLIQGRMCMIVTGKQSAQISGALKDVIDVLDAHGVKYGIYNHITSDTPIGEIFTLGKTMQSAGTEYVIGIGGGSALDAAKAAAVYASNDISPMDIFSEEYEHKPLTVVCVPTTAGTGSDTTQYAMLTLDKPANKRSFKSEECFPIATYLDSRYTTTLPLEVTRNTAIDALCHAVESYLNTKASHLSDMVALEAIRLIGQCTDALVSGDISEDVREKLLMAASAGGMAVAHTGLNLVHAMGHQVTCTKNIPHGRANGALLVEFISFIARANVMRAVNVIDAFGHELTGFKAFINKIAPIDEEITEADINLWLERSILDSVNQNCPIPVTKEDERKIFYNALVNKDRDYTKW